MSVALAHLETRRHRACLVRGRCRDEVRRSRTSVWNECTETILARLSSTGA